MRLPWQSLITLERVLHLHERGILEHSQSGLAVGKLAEDCVEGRLGNAWTSESYKAEEDNTIPGLCFAGFMLYYLVRGHCFPDGNKRVAWAATMDVLAGMGLTVRANDDESYALVIAIAEGNVSSGFEVVQWLASRLEAPEDPSSLS